MKDLVAKINEAVASFDKESTALIENGNKAAGMRARKISLDIEKMMKDFRKLSIEASKK